MFAARMRPQFSAALTRPPSAPPAIAASTSRTSSPASTAASPSPLQTKRSLYVTSARLHIHPLPCYDSCFFYCFLEKRFSDGKLILLVCRRGEDLCSVRRTGQSSAGTAMIPSTLLISSPWNTRGSCWPVLGCVPHPYLLPLLLCWRTQLISLKVTVTATSSTQVKNHQLLLSKNHQSLALP